MIVDRFIPENKRTGVSVYYKDYQDRYRAECAVSKPTSAYRRNRPHPKKGFLNNHLNNPPDVSAQLQLKVRTAVRNYLEELEREAGEDHKPPLFKPPPVDNVVPHVIRHVIQPRSPKKSQQRPASAAVRYAVQRASPVAGVTTTRKTMEVRNEKSPPSHLAGESKRQRSIRIKQEIHENTRLQTPKPAPSVWQAAKKTRLPDPPAPREERISSAPPGANGYTYYKNMTAAPPKDDLGQKIEAWANRSSPYEKQVVFNMLKQVTSKPRYDSPTIRRGHSAVASSLGGSLDGVESPRNIHSAPIKKVPCGLVATSTQHPIKDQRVYRLNGQDSRIQPSPCEERQLNDYMRQLEELQRASSQVTRKFCPLPMHQHLTQKRQQAQDYQCKVSFFQSVRSPFKSHFVIHPDFTSETLSKRKPVSHTITHLRY